MSLIIKVDRNEKSKEKIAEYLRGIALEIEKGFQVGEDWDIEGKEDPEDEDEDFDDDDYDEDDFTGATLDTGEGR